MHRRSITLLALALSCCDGSHGFSISQTEPSLCDAGAGPDGGAHGDAEACDAAPGHATITAKVAGLRNNTGKVFFALFSSADGFGKNKALRGGTTAIDAQTSSFTFHDVPPGVYGLSFFHDENENSGLDTNALGIPTEGFGFSNNAKGTFGPPDFEQIRFEHNDATANQDLVMQAAYY